jgi:hypothetical protein
MITFFNAQGFAAVFLLYTSLDVYTFFFFNNNSALANKFLSCIAALSFFFSTPIGVEKKIEIINL